MQLSSNGDHANTNRMDKFEREHKRLVDKRGLIIALLHILDAEVEIKRKLELANDIDFPFRKSIEVERSREKWQQKLAETEQDIIGMIAIIKKQASGDNE